MIIDTNTPCIGKTPLLKEMNVAAIGRYYRVATHPDWALTAAEAKELSQAGIKIFVVFEEFGKKSDLPLTRDRGHADGISALKQATNVGQPDGSAVYFAVEGLPSGYKTADLPGLRNYFSGVKAAIGSRFALGAYGDGIVCKTLLDEEFVKFTWLAAASTSFEGTKAFMASWRWSLAQMGPLDINARGLSVDLDCDNGDFGAFTVPPQTV